MDHSTHKNGQDNHNNNGHEKHTDNRNEKPTRLRKNPRLVIGSLEYFDLLMEQDENN